VQLRARTGIRGRIKQAIAQKRFFLYLVSTNPFLPTAALLPLAGISPAIDSLKPGKVELFILVMKIVSLVLASLVFCLQIENRHSRFQRLLREEALKTVAKFD
jgi:hypothetical protein